MTCSELAPVRVRQVRSLSLAASSLRAVPLTESLLTAHCARLRLTWRVGGYSPVSPMLTPATRCPSVPQCPRGHEVTVV